MFGAFKQLFLKIQDKEIKWTVSIGFSTKKRLRRSLMALRWYTKKSKVLKRKE